MKTCISGLLIIFYIGIPDVLGQETPIFSKQDSIVSSSWMAGAGYTFIDDSGDVFDKLFSVRSQWNAVPYPSRVSIGRYFRSGLGLEAIASYSEYKEGKVIDGRVNDSNKPYMGLDTRLSYDLNGIVGETGWFDPYIGIGLGYTHANDQPRGTYNAVIGFRTWITDHWGLDFSSSGKWSFGTTASNHIQHAAGVVYRFGIKKELSAKGLEKAEMVASERERQQRSDSIAALKQADSLAMALEETRALEREQARERTREKERKTAEAQQKQEISDALHALGPVYFNLNSSYLDEASKSILDTLSALMLKNPSLTLKISANADSRGTSSYNLWLSQRRADRTIQYLIAKGIDKQRLEGEAFGETRLVNHCKDGIYCTESEHRVNRRSEFTITGYQAP